MPLDDSTRRSDQGSRVDAVIHRSDLPLPARLVYLHLLLRAGQDGTCTATTLSIATALGISRPTVIAALRRLVRLGMITRDAAPNRPGLIAITGGTP